MNVGIKVLERESADANRVVASDIFAVGCVFAARRGPINAAVPFYSPSDDLRIWGLGGPTYQGGYVRKGLFENCAEYGAKIYGVRVVGTGAVSATLTLGTTWIVTAGYLGQESPGADGNNIKVELKASAADANKRDLFVSYKGPKESVYSVVESFVYQDSTTIVNAVNGRSLFIKIALSAPGAAVPAVTALTALATGADGSAPVLADYTTGFAKLNGAPVSIVLNCDFTSLAAAQALETYVEGRGDVVGVHNSPQGMSLATLASTYGVMIKQKSFMAGYRAWGKVDDLFGGFIDVPLMGHVIGAGYIRKNVQQGGFPWVAPAGVETSLRGVYELYDPLYSDGELNQVVKDINFNPVMFVPGYGFIVRTSRTMSSLAKYKSIHVRRMTNWIITSFRQSFLWIEQQGNSPRTRGRVTDSLTFFGQDIWRNGGLSTRGGVANNLAIKCDDQNNTQDMEDAGEFRADFIFHPVECIESGEINVMQTRDGMVITDK